MKITASVPATSANLGPGFDSLGIALDLWNHFELLETEGDAQVLVEIIGEGAGQLPADNNHLVAQIFQSELRHQIELGHWSEGKQTRQKYFRFVCRNHVPPGSGLGSSSTAVLGGLLLAQAYVRCMTGRALQPESYELLTRAIAIEGHGDNVAPALLGGLVIVADSDDGPIVQKVVTDLQQVVVCVPNYHFLTTSARSLLPTHISQSDAIRNIGRSMLVVEALRSADYRLLARVMSDRLHEPYRLPMIPGGADARRAALDQGAAAVSLSGAGPGLIAFAESDHVAIGEAMRKAFADAGISARFWVLSTSQDGARVVE